MAYQTPEGGCGRAIDKNKFSICKLHRDRKYLFVRRGGGRVGLKCFVSLLETGEEGGSFRTLLFVLHFL